MPDGPHKSLPMSRRWRKVLYLAGLPAFSLEEVDHAFCASLRADCAKERVASLVKEILAIACDGQGSLFGEPTVERLQGLHDSVVGYPLASALLDCTTRAIVHGHSGRSAVTWGIRDALDDRASRAVRQIEEHCLRANSTNGIAALRRRLHQVGSELHYSQLAQELLKPQNENRKTPGEKQRGLDDGVLLK